MIDQVLAAAIIIGASLFLIWAVCSLGLYLYRTRPRRNIYRLSQPVRDERSSLELFRRIMGGK